MSFLFSSFLFLSAEIIVTEEVTFYVSENTTVIGLELPKETPITKIQEVHSVTLSEGAYIVRLENLHYSVAQPKTLSIDQTAKSPVTKDVKTVKKSPEPTKEHLVFKVPFSSSTLTTRIFSTNQAVLSISTAKIGAANCNYFVVQPPQFSKEIAGDYTNPLAPLVSFGGQYFTRPPTV